MRGSTILTVEQLPDSRRAILVALKQRGSATISQLAALLGLTGEAVRQQLVQMHRDGWIESGADRSAERGRTGRPAARYLLSQAGDHLFPKQYDALSIAVLDAVTEKLGAEAATKVLERLVDGKVAALEPAMRGLSLTERVATLKSWYLDDDPFMSTEEAGDGYRLVERNCPFLNTAMGRPMLCSISVNALTRLLGVRVEREERFQNGDGRCVFRIQAGEPVDVDNWTFEPESFRSR
ncbi:MAG TPA: winged helix-turn-helix transcriptional regulator [Thermoanaerobaculia bacterium]|nr:winged helix-turn-helix transcriptional regulator [Thermoanaerobaculia bacterium]